MELFDINELVRCARREVAFRRRVYPRLVFKGKMTQLDSEREIALMLAILDNLELQQHPKLF